MIDTLEVFEKKQTEATEWRITKQKVLWVKKFKLITSAREASEVFKSVCCRRAHFFGSAAYDFQFVFKILEVDWSRLLRKEISCYHRILEVRNKQQSSVLFKKSFSLKCYLKGRNFCGIYFCGWRYQRVRILRNLFLRIDCFPIICGIYFCGLTVFLNFCGMYFYRYQNSIRFLRKLLLESRQILEVYKWEGRLTRKETSLNGYKLFLRIDHVLTKCAEFIFADQPILSKFAEFNFADRPFCQSLRKLILRIGAKSAIII